jgi:small-conductance mechanosensitive channel
MFSLLKITRRSWCGRVAVGGLVVVAGLAAAADEQASPPDLIAFLNQTIVWFRQITAQQQLANQPSDVLFLSDNRQIAEQVVRLSFEFARARAQVLAAEGVGGAANAGQAGNANQYQNLANVAGKADQQVKQSQQELDGLRRRLDTAVGKKRHTLQLTIDETQSELDLREARRDALRSILEFVSGTAASGSGSGGLQAQVEELARTVPAASTSLKQPSGQNPAAPVAVTSKSEPEPSGILSLVTDLLALRRKITTLNQAEDFTDGMLQSQKAMMRPLVGSMRALAKQGDILANQPDSTDPAVLADQKKQLDTMTAQFKQLSASVVPLAKEGILLNLYKRTVANWRDTVRSQYNAELKGLVLRLVVLAIIIALVFGISELWRKATFRYVQDVRRRYQFLLLRRFAVWFLIVMILAVAFASELGSLATFAGLLTAGVAVALQNVILSVAGYFFLIGKYGIRVGDRVQIAGVFGEVVDIGLVRLHLMELGEGGSAARPTGRVVVFSNAVVFQANAGLFKQIPGTKFGWHEITLTVAPQTDYHQVEKRVLEIVRRVFADYKEVLELQRRSMERALSPLSIHSLGPESRLRIAPGGLEIVIRYPVEMDKAAEIDDRITRELLNITERDPNLRFHASSATPQPV